MPNLVFQSERVLYVVRSWTTGQPEIEQLSLDCHLGYVDNDSTLYTVKRNEKETKVFRHSLTPKVQNLSSVNLPDVHVHSLIARQGNLYLGSRDLWHIDFNKETPEVRKLDKVPPESIKEDDYFLSFFQNKTIDALAISENTLYAVDNVMEPKFLLLFNLSDPQKPVHIESRDFGGGINQRVQGADANENHLILFESFSRMDGWGKLISVYALNPIKKLKEHEQYFPRTETESTDERSPWNNSVLIGDRFFISAGKQGIMSFPIGEKEKVLSLEKSAPCLWLKAVSGWLISLQGETALLYDISSDLRIEPISITFSSPCRRIF